MPRGLGMHTCDPRFASPLLLLPFGLLLALQLQEVLLQLAGLLLLPPPGSLRLLRTGNQRGAQEDGSRSQEQV